MKTTMTRAWAMKPKRGKILADTVYYTKADVVNSISLHDEERGCKPVRVAIIEETLFNNLIGYLHDA